MKPGISFDLTTALLLVSVTCLVALDEWGISVLSPAIPWVMLMIVALLAVRVSRSRQAFILAAAVLTVLLAMFVPDWRETALKGVRSAAFIAAFFIALSTLRNVAETSPAIGAGGTFLAAQPPGRRYAALTVGGHLFALLLNYGAISLLGSLATASARDEPDPEIRRHRTRRMLLAIQRGFISSLPWSPLAFAMAITTALIPGARWADAVGPGVVSALIIAGTGWALDSIFKPRLGRPPRSRGPVEGSWLLLAPLLGLLVALAVVVGSLHEMTGVRVVGIVMAVVPLLAAGWALLQHSGQGVDFPLRKRVRDYLVSDLPGNSGGIALLTMAGYIGTIGAPLLAPAVAWAGFDPSGLPAWALLAALVWFIPLLGQFGMNPILAVTLIAPLIPDPSAMGVPPSALVSAIAAGWAISGTSSPFTATTLLIGSFGNVSALHVGLRWNGGFVLVAGTALTVWVLVYAFLLA